MLIIGEKINSSNKKIASALEKRDSEYLIKLAREQREAGADYIDLNAGTFLEDEAEILSWMVKTIQSEIPIPCCLDSPNPVALAKALEIHHGKALINSITGEAERQEKLIPLVIYHQAKVIVLSMGEKGIPETPEERVEIAAQTIRLLKDEGIPLSDIYIDPVVQPIAITPSAAQVVLEVIEMIVNRYAGVHTVCGISNISYGLPARRYLNAGFLLKALARGLDAAILDPTDPLINSLIFANDVLTGKDSYGLKYISAFRKGIIR